MSIAHGGTEWCLSEVSRRQNAMKDEQMMSNTRKRNSLKKIMWSWWRKFYYLNYLFKPTRRNDGKKPEKQCLIKFCEQSDKRAELNST